MKMDRKNIEKLLFVGAVLILFYLGLQNMDVVFNFLQWLFHVMMPFVIAMCCTLFLNVPLKAIEKRLFRPKNGKEIHPVLEKARRPVALTLSMLIFIAVIVAFLIIIIPEIGRSLNTLAKAVPSAIENLSNRITELSEENDYVKEIVNNVDIDWKVVTNYVTSFLQNDAAGIVGYAMGMLSSVLNVAVNIFLGIVLSVYTLMNKEKISTGLKKFLYAILPMRTADFIVEVGVLTNKSFYNCITGQMMECVILGSLTALGMTILGFPYAALVGVMVAILSWIPMFGVYIGAGIGALFLLTSDPMQAVWFLVFMVCLQQIEGNLIYPRVVGNNVGLPPIILISAIVIFSNFFGIVGLLVSAAVTSVLYTLIRRYVFMRLRKKKIPHEKYDRGAKPKPRVHSAKHNSGKKIKFHIPMKINIKNSKKAEKKK